MATGQSEPDILESLRPLMEKYGVSCSPKQFYDAVNLHFHAAESRVYDKIHREMWQVLPRQFALLTNDCLPVSAMSLRVLDIGSGTGLSAELFLKTNLGSRTNEIHLLDTSKEMLKRAAERARHWPVAVRAHCHSISELPVTEQFDVILVCSVLHHISDLMTFLNHVHRHQKVGGLFLHFQDQNADYAGDKQYLCRLAEFRAAHTLPSRRHFIQKLVPKRLIQRAKWEWSKRYNYIARTNRSLMRAGIINRGMDELDIWRVTDIRISPTINGISLRGMRSLLPHYELISTRSYSFYGESGENLLGKFRSAETHLIEQRAMNGHLVAGAWKRRN